MAKSSFFEKLLTSFSQEQIFSSLSPFLSEKRRERIEPILRQRLSSVHIAVESPADIHNALAIVRTSEALGLLHVHIIGWPKKRRGKDTMKGADRWVEIHYYDTLEEFVHTIHQKKICLFGATPRGVETLEHLPVDSPLCLMFGNENEGLSEQATFACERQFKIPMYGFSESLNLSVSAAISLFDITKRRRAFLQDIGDLSAEEMSREKAWFCVRTLGFEQSRRILAASA